MNSDNKQHPGRVKSNITNGYEGIKISERIKELLEEAAYSCVIQDVRIGLGYTAVLLENGNCGVAYTFRDEFRGGCSVFHGVRPLVGRYTRDILAYLGSNDTLESAVGLASANALIGSKHSAAIEGDILDVLVLQPEDNVVMVGYFGPIVSAIRNKVAYLKIFEKRMAHLPFVFPADMAYEALRECDVALITSTAIINNTADKLLEAAKSCRKVILLGASTPLIPEAFLNTPVSWLSGINITRPAEILRIVSEGGGMHFFKENIKKINIPLNA